MRCCNTLTYAIAVVLVIGLTGCGGGGHKVQFAEIGSVGIIVAWPERPDDVQSQLIPVTSNSIKAEIDGIEKTLTINRPEISGTLEGVPIGQYTLRATAYPNSNATGVPQATAQKTITVIAGHTDEHLTLQSTIEHIDIGPRMTSVQVGESIALTATAKDASDRTVLVRTDAPFTWTVESGEAHATVDADGVVTGVSVGEAVVKATEAESEVSGTATVTVGGGAPVEGGYEFVTTWGSEGSGSGQFYWPEGVAVDADGNVYLADTWNDRIQKFSGSGAFITKWGSYGSGDGQFCGPWGVAVDADGSVYVADTDNHRIQKFSGSGTFITKWGSEGSGDGQFYGPYGVAVDARGNVYVADTWNDRIQKFSGTGTFITKWGSRGSGDGQFDLPESVAVDADGNVYVADADNHRIQKFSGTGTFITKWGSEGSGDGQFDHPYGVGVDADGNVYVADTDNHRIQKFSGTGTFITKWGSWGSGDGQFDSPESVAVDAHGNVYVADKYNYRIQKFRPVAP